MSLDLDLSLDTLIASGAYPDSIMPVCDAIFAWKRKPHAMVEDLFGVKPDPWQREALEAFPPSLRMLVRKDFCLRHREKRVQEPHDVFGVQSRQSVADLLPICILRPGARFEPSRGSSTRS